jgi:hypothetical protein
VKHVVEAVEVGAQNGIPIVARECRENIVPMDAGVAYDAVVGTVCRDVGFEHGARGAAIRDVELQHAGTAACALDLFRGAARSVVVGVIVHRDGESIVREARGDRGADAFARAGDEHGSHRAVLGTRRRASSSADGR